MVREEALQALRAHLEEVLGVDDAAAVVREFPGGDVATKDDLARLEERMASKEDLAALEERMASKEDLAALEERMASDLAALEERMASDLAALEERMASKEDLAALGERLENRLTATFRGELVAQTRSVFFGLIGAFIAMAGLMIAIVA
jgi:DNA-binding transcriptional regulator YbjK